MKTDVQTPMEVFYLPQLLEVPHFQRPYVWDKEDQWAPLWQDVRQLADWRLRDPYATATHFLGAVVVQANEGQTGRLPSSNIIDGQQRLTTLQILMDAAALVVDEAGLETLAGQLAALTHNQENFVEPGQSRLKLRHTNRDRDAFDEVMNAEPPVHHDSLQHSGSRITRAHEFFVGSIYEWLGDSFGPAFGARADTLVSVLTRGLQLVVINLSAGENSQEIFETLNARGTPLTATDLIKNFVFQRLAAEGDDATRAYSDDWPFDTKFWETEVSAGRHRLPRSSLFLNQWLVSRTGEEISPQSTFTRFKSYIERESGRSLRELLPIIRRQAAMYEAWTVASADVNRQLTPVEMAVYRMQANGVEVLKPLLLWLHSPDRSIPVEVIEAVIATAESWVIRRQLLRLTSADLGRIVADVIRIHRDVDSDQLNVNVQAHLARLNVSSTYWPGDEELRRTLATESVYRRFKRGRMRMLLEAVEDRFRAETNQQQVRRGYPVEHVLPQKWETNWHVDGLEAEQERAAHVHRLGNLTLLTQTLNSKVSNGPWQAKRESFKEHDTLLLTSRLLRSTEDSAWNEQAIDERTMFLIDHLLDIWPAPDGHLGEIVDSQSRDADWVEVKHLVAAGLLQPGTRLVPRPGKWASDEAFVTSEGSIALEGRTFESPSGAGKHVRGRATNGWVFWRLDDGRTLKDVRSIYRGTKPDEVERFDWSLLHDLLEALPHGRWTTYGSIASVIGTAAQPVGSHIASCRQCTNAHRVLRSEGKIAQNFAWPDPLDARSPLELLEGEGIAVVKGRADRTKELIVDELSELISAEMEN